MNWTLTENEHPADSNPVLAVTDDGCVFTARYYGHYGTWDYCLPDSCMEVQVHICRWCPLAAVNGLLLPVPETIEVAK